MKEAILLLIAIVAFICILLCTLFSYQLFGEIQSIRFYLEKKYLEDPVKFNEEMEFPDDEI